MINKFLAHIGIKRRSGRYPWGSGGHSQQRGSSFLGYVDALRKEGLSEVQIAEGMGISTTQLRARKSIARNEQRAALLAQATRLREKGMSNVAIGQRLKMPESSVRALFNKDIQDRANIISQTANMLREHVDQKKMIDVGAGVETHLGIARTKLNTAISLLEEEGYKVHYVKVKQLGTGKDTSIKVLTRDDLTYSDVAKNRSEIKPISDYAYTPNKGRSYYGLKPIEHIKSDRILIRYKEDGGGDKDGVIELRRNVEDLALGQKNYAQVRIGVDGTHYLKGMAMHTIDKMPPGVDIIYNTSKPKGTDPKQVFKELKDDPDNPFGTVIKPNGQRRALNIVNEENDWKEWSRNISTQVLSKQSPALAKKQLDLALAAKQREFDEIEGITNPVVKKRLLKSLSDDLDASAVHLKAAALPRQSSHVLLPITSLKENEIYAPANFRDGERVVLIRHPHGGIFEIPELVVNNKNPEGRKVLGNAMDAVGIHPKTASKLSGADFDGDTAIVIPNKDGLIKTAPSLKALKDFDPKSAYPSYDGMPKMSSRTKQMQMGDVSNLITDMTIKGATPNEIARAVRHSMVVIDAEKHNLNYKQSAIDNGIAELKKKYQGGERAGASTLISKASSEVRVPHREDGKLVPNPKTGGTKRLYYDPVTGQKLYEPTGETFVNAKGKTVKKTTKSTKMAEVEDAFELSSGTKIENIYAEYANKVKAMANKARKMMIDTANLVYNPSAKETYAKEVASLKSKLALANRNKPRERQAQLLANKIVAAKKSARPDMDAATLKKIKGQALEEARIRSGAKKQDIQITDKEWEAIQLGAVSHNVLTQIIDNTDLDRLKTKATPRATKLMTPSKVLRAKLMLANGKTYAEIAAALGVSSTTVQDELAN
jgi:DNA-binding CsgD family transcriptional regulator